jgi:predicted O-methyltransferase YrrM
MNLHALIPVRGVLPESRGWAASPDLLLTYIGQILNGAPDLVVECGSGLSTLWAALALETLGGTGRVVALEHDPRFLAGTRASLEAHGVAHRAEVRHAPIDEVVVGERRQPWYAPSALNGLDGIGVLFVDGPIGSLDPQARYPAVPLMRGRLRPGAAILLDDADRPEEKDVVAHWLSDWPELDSQVLRLEKGAVLLRVPS